MAYTYTTLKQAIQDYTDNDEAVFVSQIDNFIKNTEERILGEGQLEIFRKNASATMTASNKYLPKPSDWLFTYSLSFTDGNGDINFIQNKDVNFIQEFWTDGTDTGSPRYYSDYDVDNFILAPTPSSNFTTEIHYFYRPTSIVSAGSSWLGTNAPTCLLYGSLVEAFTFMKGEPDMVQQYQQLFMSAMQQLGKFSNTAEGLDFYKRPSA